MDGNRPLATSAGKDPQIPVPDKNLTWVEVRIIDLFIAYVLIAAADADATDLDTGKGRFTVQPGRELWYSATQDVGEVSSAESITWHVKKVVGDDEAGHAELIAAINASAGLADSSGAAAPALVGPSGPVIWAKKSLPEGVTTFEWESASGYKWQLSLEQSGSTLATVAWSTDDGTNSPNANATALPDKFGADGAEIELAKVADPAYDYVFDSYT